MRLDWYKKSPDGYKAMLGLQRVVNQSQIEEKLLELVKIRASQINGCAYCIDSHTKDAIAIGESEQRLLLLSVWRETKLFSEREKAALEWCEALTELSLKGAPDNIYKNLEILFNQEETVELTLAITAINAWNRLVVAFKKEVGNYDSHKKKKE